MILEAAVIVLGLLWAVTLWLFVSHVRRQRVLVAQQAAADEQRDRRLRELARRLDTYQNGNVQMGEALHELRAVIAPLPEKLLGSSGVPVQANLPFVTLPRRSRATRS